MRGCARRTDEVSLVKDGARYLFCVEPHSAQRRGYRRRRTGTEILRNMEIPRRTSARATSCGVDIITAPVLFMCVRSEIVNDMAYQSVQPTGRVSREHHPSQAACR